VNTPSPLAQKYWITNGALHAHHIVVFAHLISGGVNHGIHAVLVPIRDKDLNVLPDVLVGSFAPSQSYCYTITLLLRKVIIFTSPQVEEMGFKMGLNGVDNAKLTFNNVRGIYI